MYLVVKTLVTALIVVSISELARRFSLFAAALASLPLTSILALIWLYHDTHDLQKIAELCDSILWLVVPSLLFFILLPLFIKYGFRFYPALALSCLMMALGYGLFIYLKKAL